MPFTPTEHIFCSSPFLILVYQLTGDRGPAAQTVTYFTERRGWPHWIVPQALSTAGRHPHVWVRFQAFGTWRNTRTHILGPRPFKVSGPTGQLHLPRADQTGRCEPAPPVREGWEVWRRDWGRRALHEVQLTLCSDQSSSRCFFCLGTSKSLPLALSETKDVNPFVSE